MHKIQVISDHDAIKFQSAVNEFVKDKKVVDIKYQAFPVPIKYGMGGIITEMNIVNRAMVIYKEFEKGE